jgi:hypothetical protein
MALATSSIRAPAFLSWRHQRWPRTFAARWGLRLLLAAPYVALADIADALTGASASNRGLVRRASELHVTSSNLGWVAHTYPPLPLAVAKFFPGGGKGLAVAGALCAGYLVHATIERLILRSVPTLLAVLLTAAVVVTPAFCFVATQDFSAFITLGLLATAVTGLLDFTYNRATESGFIAGIAFCLSALCTLAALPFAVAGALSVIFVLPEDRLPREIARRRAAVTVVLFPSAAAVAGWIFLQWRFSGSWSRSVQLANSALFRFPGGSGVALLRSASAVGHELFLAPVLVVGSALLLLRRPRSAVAALIFVACVIFDVWCGTSLSGPTVVVLLGMVGLVLVPEQPTRFEQRVLAVAAIAQLVIAMVGLTTILPAVAHWTERLAALTL